MPWLLVGAAGAAWMVGRALRDAGQGADAAGNGALKLALAAGAAYLVASKTGLLK